MTTQTKEELDAFREEVAAYLDTAPTDAIREGGRKTTSAFAPFEQGAAWQAILNEKAGPRPIGPRNMVVRAGPPSSAPFSRKNTASGICRPCCRTLSRWWGRC